LFEQEVNEKNITSLKMQRKRMVSELSPETAVTEKKHLVPVLHVEEMIALQVNVEHPDKTNGFLQNSLRTFSQVIFLRTLKTSRYIF